MVARPFCTLPAPPRSSVHRPIPALLTKNSTVVAIGVRYFPGTPFFMQVFSLFFFSRSFFRIFVWTVAFFCAPLFFHLVKNKLFIFFFRFPFLLAAVLFLCLGASAHKSARVVSVCRCFLVSWPRVGGAQR
ncbi:hypothetical protein [Pandoravirus japonicus]|uniref:Transmembrane protein n=1 Tax=Pandoravirus japonicus TaxID=2823154 RepID=A0A811BPK7_9VIRU|nr:hypothetical protein [Pandoravirus japonicus]